MKAVGKCVTGMQRENNEDAIFLSDDSGSMKDIYVVADGMGGHNAGEVASNGAIEAFQEYLERNREKLNADEDIFDMLVGAVTYANSVIYQKAQELQQYAGMGTTFTAVAIRDSKLYIVHVGDSRLYVYRSGVLKQMTKDHSYVMEMVKWGKMTLEEAKNHPSRNVITRALGTAETVEIDTVIEQLYNHDIVLLCSDGLSGMLTAADMEAILAENRSLKEAVEKLVQCANEKGGSDNISVILLKQEVPE